MGGEGWVKDINCINHPRENDEDSPEEFVNNVSRFVSTNNDYCRLELISQVVYYCILLFNNTTKFELYAKQLTLLKEPHSA